MIQGHLSFSERKVLLNSERSVIINNIDYDNIQI